MTADSSSPSPDGVRKITNYTNPAMSPAEAIVRARERETWISQENWRRIEQQVKIQYDQDNRKITNYTNPPMSPAEAIARAWERETWISQEIWRRIDQQVQRKYEDNRKPDRSKM